MGGRHGRKGSNELTFVFAIAAAVLAVLVLGGAAFAVRAAFAPKFASGPSGETPAAAAPSGKPAASATATKPAVKPASDPTKTAPAVTASSPAATASGKRQFVPVLMYHHIKPNPDNFIAISPETFDRQMSYLKEHGYHAITMAQFNEFASKGMRLPDKPVLITFDDGRHNQLDYGVPILKKYGFTATFFVCKKWVTGGTKAFMDEEEIRGLVADGYDVESHTNSHKFLVKSRTESSARMQERLWGETHGMKVWLEGLTGKPVTALAYPGGATDKYTPGLAKAAGYTTAYTTDSGLNYYGGQNQYLIRRYNAGAKGLTFKTYTTIFTHKPVVK